MDKEATGAMLAVLGGVAGVLTASVPGTPTMSVAEALPIAAAAGGIFYVLLNHRDGVDDLHFQQRQRPIHRVRIIVARGNVRDERARLITLSCILIIYLLAASVPGRAFVGPQAFTILLTASVAPLLATVAVGALSLNSWRRRQERIEVRDAIEEGAEP